MPSTKGTKQTKKRPHTRAKPRTFSGNRFTAAKEAENNTSATGASAKKIRLDENSSLSSDDTNFYVILAFSTIFGPLSNLIKCKKCDGDINFQKSPMYGLGFQLHVICDCSETKLDSCPKIGSKTNKAWEINRKIVFIMRLIGVGFHGVNLFCAMMDIANNFSRDTYYGSLKNIGIACETIFKKCIHKAAREEQEKNKAAGKPERELSVSGDGTWSKRGFSSLLGVITLIGKQTGKILDLIVKNSICFSCKKMTKKLSAEDFEIWYDEHAPECSSNHTGSAGKMEVSGVIEMFKRSEDLHDIRYREYIGDGDSKTFINLQAENVYGPDFAIRKLECVLHVGKRMFKRLMEAKFFFAGQEN